MTICSSSRLFTQSECTSYPLCTQADGASYDSLKNLAANFDESGASSRYQAHQVEDIFVLTAWPFRLKKKARYIPCLCKLTMSPCAGQPTLLCFSGLHNKRHGRERYARPPGGGSVAGRKPPRRLHNQSHGLGCDGREVGA